MKGRDIVIALLVLALLGGLVYWRQRGNNNNGELKVPEVQSSTEENLEDKFKIEIPDDADKTELEDATGGNSSGIVSTKFENNKLTGSVIADLPVLPEGEFYQVWVEKGEKGSDDYSVTPIGRLASAKGGYVLNLNSSTNYRDTGDKLLITSEKTADNTPEKTVLEGSF